MSKKLQDVNNNKEKIGGDHRSGLLTLMKNETIPQIINVLLNAPPHREFNQTELAEHASISPQSVSRYIDLLLEVGIVEPVERTSRQRYRFDSENQVSKALIDLDSALNTVEAEFECDL